MANTIDDLRSHLFDTLAALKDKESPMDLDRARAVADVAKVLVESAKVEVAFLKVTGAVKSTGFMPEADTAGGLVVRRQIGKVTEPAVPAGDRCVLCGCKLTTAYAGVRFIRLLVRAPMLVDLVRKGRQREKPGYQRTRKTPPCGWPRCPPQTLKRWSKAPVRRP